MKEPEVTAEQVGEIAGQIVPYIAGGGITKGVAGITTNVLKKYAPKLAGTALGKIIPSVTGMAALGGMVAAGREAVKGAAAPEDFQVSEALKEIGTDAARFAAFGAAGQVAGQPTANVISRALSASLRSGRISPQLAQVFTAMGRGGATGTTLASVEAALKYLKNPEEFDAAEAAGDVLTTGLFFTGLDTIFTLGSMAGQGFRLRGVPAGDLRSAYAELGLKPGASYQQVKNSYRNLAKQYHPDVAAGDKAAATEKFKRIALAYAEILSSQPAAWKAAGAASPAARATTQPAPTQAEPGVRGLLPEAGQAPGVVVPPPAPVTQPPAAEVETTVTAETPAATQPEVPPVATTPAATPEAPAKQTGATTVTPMSDTDKQPWEMSKGEFEAKALYQGVRAGNVDDRHGLSGYVTPLPGTARAFGEREGAGFLMNITYNENMPEGTFTDPDTGKELTPEEFWKYRGQVGTGLPEEIRWVTQLKFADLEQAKEFAKDPHKFLVQRALSEGKPVPPEVLADYPELRAEGKPSSTKAASPAEVKPEAKAETPTTTVTLNRPVEEVKQQNYRMPLSQYTDKLYHETNIENALRMADPGIMADMTNQQIYFSSDPDLALGQGKSKGVLIEL
jgi:hypothetical protein